MPFQFINKIGVEIEGGWMSLPQTTNGRWTGDGSVRITDIPYVGELVSVPFDDISLLKNWMISVWPTSVNSSCGLHCHFSFKKKSDYSRLMDKRFYAYFVERMTEWGKVEEIRNENFHKRLRGENSYCKKLWTPDEQVVHSTKGDHRYNHWNFCYTMHKTAECRLLPTFKDKNYGAKAVGEIANIVETFLAMAPLVIEIIGTESDFDSVAPQLVEERI